MFGRRLIEGVVEVLLLLSVAHVEAFIRSAGLPVLSVGYQQQHRLERKGALIGVIEGAPGYTGPETTPILDTIKTPAAMKRLDAKQVLYG